MAGRFDTGKVDAMAMPVMPVEPGEVLARVKRLWAPGMKLIVGKHVQDPKEQHRLYHEIHQLCS